MLRTQLSWEHRVEKSGYWYVCVRLCFGVFVFKVLFIFQFHRFPLLKFGFNPKFFNHFIAGFVMLFSQHHLFKFEQCHRTGQILQSTKVLEATLR